MKRSSRPALRLEGLEARITPSSSELWIDGDGDKVRFTVSRGDISGHISQSFPNYEGVFSVDISAPSFNGTNLTVSVTKSKTGDGSAIVGHIDAGANDLGKVSVAGDLGDIDCGSGSAIVAALKALSVCSFGRFGETGTGDFVSRINGNSGPLTVKGDQIQTYFRVEGDLASASIGGSLVGSDSGDSGEIYAAGNLGRVTIKRDIRGGDGAYSGSVGAGVNVASVAVGGSLIGGGDDNSGNIYAALTAAGKINNVSIGGSLIGGGGVSSGTIGGETVGVAGPYVSLGIVTIGHDIVGGNGPSDAEVWARGGGIDKLTVNGSVIGGGGEASGSISAAEAAGKLSIGGSVYGGSGDESAQIVLSAGAKSFSIGGSLLGGKGAASALIPFTSSPIELLEIGHDIRGGSGVFSATVQARVTKLILRGSAIPGTGAASGMIG